MIVRRPGGAGQQQWLLVRNSYKPGYSVPCGGVERGESAREAAARELEEEVGLHIEPRALIALGEIELTSYHRRDRAHFFLLELGPGPGPALQIDRREVIWADFVDRERLDGLELVPHLARVLTRPADWSPKALAQLDTPSC